MSHEDLLQPSLVRQRLQRLGSKPVQAWQDRGALLKQSSLTNAAVLIPMTEYNGEMHLLFTKRAETLRSHSGEVSFPGGRADDTDKDLLHTALREANEEVSLLPDDVYVYGALVRMPTITGFEVTSFVGEFTQPYSLHFNPDEIDAGFLAPLSALADEKNHRIEEHAYRGVVYPLHFFDFEGHTIWGATGYMLHLLLDFLGLRE